MLFLDSCIQGLSQGVLIHLYYFHKGLFFLDSSDVAIHLIMDFDAHRLILRRVIDLVSVSIGLNDFAHDGGIDGAVLSVESVFQDQIGLILAQTLANTDQLIYIGLHLLIISSYRY